MKFPFFKTVKSKVIISLFETVKLSVSISPRNLYNSLKNIMEMVSIDSVCMMRLYEKTTVQSVSDISFRVSVTLLILQ